MAQQKYKCEKCGFSWTPRTSEIPKRCPYCGRTDSLTVPSSEAFFRDIEDLLSS